MIKLFLIITIILLSGCTSQSVNDFRTEIIDVQRDVRQLKRLDTVPDISILYTIENIVKINEDEDVDK